MVFPQTVIGLDACMVAIFAEELPAWAERRCKPIIRN